MSKLLTFSQFDFWVICLIACACFGYGEMQGWEGNSLAYYLVGAFVGNRLAVLIKGVN